MMKNVSFSLSKGITAAGVVMMSAALAELLIRTGNLSDMYRLAAVPGHLIILFCMLTNRQVEVALLESMIPVYRMAIKGLVLIFLLVLFVAGTDSFIGAVFLLIQLQWIGRFTRRSVLVRVSAAGLLFIAALWGAEGTGLISCFALFSAGLLVLLFGLERYCQNKRGYGSALYEIFETSATAFLFTAVPLLAAIGGYLFFQDWLIGVNIEYSPVEATGMNIDEARSGLIRDALILAGLLVLLVFVWKKLANRGKNNEQMPEEQGLEQFGRNRLLDLNESAYVRSHYGSYRGKVIDLYFRLIDQLARLGVAKNSQETPEEFSAVLADRGLISLNEMMGFISIYLKARFSAQSVTREEYDLARERFGDIRNIFLEK